MNKLTTILSKLALAGILGISIASCTSETTGPGTTGPSGVMVAGLSSASLGVMWTGDGGTDTAVAMNAAGATVATATGTNSATLTGLTTNTLYTIVVRSGNGTSAPVTWMTAMRKDGIKIYQYSSTQFSGLDLKNMVTVTAGNTSSQPYMDFLLDDKEHDAGITNPSGISFEAPQVFSPDPNWRDSHIDIPDHYVVGGLSSDYSSASYAAQYATLKADAPEVGNVYDIPNDAVYATKGSRVLLVRTQDGNFAKVEIVPDPTTGMLYSGTGTNKYITVNVSYQPAVDQPYAARPRHARAAGKEARVSAQ